MPMEKEQTMATDNTGDFSGFVKFASAQLQAGTELTPEAAVEQWRAMHPSDVEAEDIEAMVQEAIDDIAAGGHCISSEEFESELEREFGFKPPKRRT
jgi:hypothetical protein